MLASHSRFGIHAREMVIVAALLAFGLGGCPPDPPTPPCTKSPTAPCNLVPRDGTTDASRDVDFYWSCGLSECGLGVTHDVYLGTRASLGNGDYQGSTSSTSWDPPTLHYGTRYHWKIVARDENGSTSSEVCSFTTEEEEVICTDPPSSACAPSPANGARDVAGSATLAWGCGTSLCGHDVTYDVYLGTDPSLGESEHQGSTTSRSWTPPALDHGEMYYWKVVARDQNGSVPGDVWHFSTDAGNEPPSLPGSPTPGDGAAAQSTLDPQLCWVCSDPDGDALVFDVYFGTDLPLPLVSEGQSEYCYASGRLHNNTLYRWRVVARDGMNQPVSGATWAFTTEPTTTIVLHSQGNDTYVDSENPYDIHCDSSDLYVGGGLYQGYRTYLWFDFSAVPSGAVIPDGGWKLFLWQWEVYPSVQSGDDICLFRSDGAWSECRLGWADQPSRDNTDICCVEAADEEYAWVQIWDPEGHAFTELVREMISGEKPNHGFQVWNDFDRGTHVAFRSTGYGDPAKWPRFEVTYIW